MLTTSILFLSVWNGFVFLWILVLKIDFYFCSLYCFKYIFKFYFFFMYLTNTYTNGVFLHTFKSHTLKLILLKHRISTWKCHFDIMKHQILEICSEVIPHLYNIATTFIIFIDIIDYFKLFKLRLILLNLFYTKIYSSFNIK